MDSFLNQLQHHLNEKHQNHFQDLTIIFPGRRAAAFFKHHILTNNNQPVVLPVIYSIEDFTSRLSGMKQLNAIQLILEFYKAYKEVEGARAEDFDQFLKWAPTMMADFSELDAYLVSTQKAFQYLEDIRALEVWNPDGTEPTDVQKDYVKFWEKMGVYYHGFHNRLIKDKVGYSGLMYRYLAENLNALWQAKKEDLLQPNGQLVFAGFNALNNAEVQLLDFFREEGKLSVYWDADEYYLNNKDQEAGLFLRKFQNRWPGKIFTSTGFKEAKQIEIIESPNEIAQASALHQLLNASTKNEPADRGVVLANEELLLPVLNNLPANEKKVNATLGYLLKLSPVYGFLDAFISIYWNAIKLKGNTDVFYHSNIEQWLKQPLFQNMPAVADFNSEVLQLIKEKNRIFISKKWWNRQVEAAQLPSKLKTLLNFSERTTNEILTKSIHWIDFLHAEWLEKPKETEQQVTSEFLGLFHRELLQLQDLLLQAGLEFSVHSLKQLLSQVISRESLAFTGEPLGGLQIMGMLETRLLDFKQITLLSVNEGVLPKGKKGSSFFPYDARISFGLPTHHEKDAIFAYYFYRAIQRAKKIQVLYSSDQEGFSKGEKSRFLLQLEEELPQYAPRHEISHQQLSIDIPSSVSTEETLEKDDEVLHAIYAFFQRGVSPSSMNTYFNSSLDFYYQYIVQLREEQGIEEEVEDSRFGNILHAVLEDIYAPLVHQELSSEMVLALKDEALGNLKKHYESFYSDAYKTGEIWLSYQISKKFLIDFLEQDAERAEAAKQMGSPIQIIALEKKYLRTLNFNGSEIQFKGTVDRVERCANKITVIDYKSGIVKREQLQLKQTEHLISGEVGKVLQLFLYQWLYEPCLEKGETIDAAIISLANLKEGLIKSSKNKDVTGSDNELILKTMQYFVEEIINQDVPFTRPFDYKYPLFE